MGWWINFLKPAMITIMLMPHVARLVALSDKDVSFRDGARIFSTGELVRSIYVVRQGGVRMLRRQAGGASLVVQRVPSGGLVAEASVFAARYHCEALAEGQTVLARIPKPKVLALQLEDPGWLQQFAAHLAGEVQRARARAELLSLKKVSERLDAWFSLHSGAMPERGQWVAWAAELAVSPEALYRELAVRRA
jgi:CRP/FNR family transcriptional regulator, dissimilatory nitrate respiration regulator